MMLTMQGWRVYASTLLLSGLFAAPATAQQEVSDMKLEDAGFKMRAADTSKKMERLRQLPPHRFVRRTKNGRSYYLYADPTVCKCVFLGGQSAMNNYRAMRSPAASGLPGYVGPTGNKTENEMILSMDSDLDNSILPDDDLLNFPFE
jgi:hypothetical protein